MSLSSSYPPIDAPELLPVRPTAVARGFVGTFLLVASLALFGFLLFRVFLPGQIPPIVESAAFWATLPFGQVGVFSLPLLLFFLSLAVFCRHSWRRTVLRCLALLFFALTLSCMISLSVKGAAGVSRDDTRALRLAGIFGEFIIHPKGLGLAILLGPDNAWTICGGLLAGWGMLMTDFFFIPALYGVAPQWFHRLRFWRRRRPSVEQETLAPPAPAFASHPGASIFGATLQTAGVPAAALAFTAPAHERTIDLWSAHGPAGSASANAHAIQNAPAGAAPPATPMKTGDDDLLTFAAAPLTAAAPVARQPSIITNNASRSQAQPTELDLFGDYQLPQVSLMAPPPQDQDETTPEELQRQAELLEQKLLDFKIEARVTHITKGPVITRFEVKPAPGVKVSRISSLENDLAMTLAALTVRIQAPIPGKDTVGIEIPNSKPTPVFIREILETEEFRTSRKHLPCCLGKTISGQPLVADLVEMPHLLIAGTTGSGKSVCLNAIICSLLMRFEPNRLKFIMVDPKRVELNVYQDIPHLLAPVVNDPRKAAGALNWMVEQMEERYKLLADFNVRNIDGFNTMFDPKNYSKKLIGHNLQPMPRIVVIIDELADLMMVARNEVEDAVIRLAQMARAVGIHLILATQRPSVNVITGIIKANFPVRIAFRVSSNVDSRTILDTKGAETLLGKGDMLYMSVRSPRPERLQGCFVSDKEVEMLTDFIRNQRRAVYVMQDFKAPSEIEKERMEASMAMEQGEETASGSRDGNNWEVMGQMTRPDGSPMDAQEIWSEYLGDDLFRAGSKLILQNRSASVSLIQRRLKVGFARSGRLMDMLQESGIVGEHKGSKPRDIIVDPIQYLNLIEQFEAQMQK